MSFDLYLWREPSPITAARAAAVLDRLAEGDDEAVRPDARNLAFHADLLERFPALETLSDAGMEASPWNMSPDATDRRVILCMAWSTAAKTSAVVLDLARRHGLVCYDPQSSQIHNLPAEGPGLRLELADGSVFTDPDAATLRALLAAIDERNWYACLERDPERFAQVAMGHLDGVPEHLFTFEYREGPGSHHGTSPIRREEAVELVLAYAAGDMSWKDRHTWHEIE